MHVLQMRFSMFYKTHIKTCLHLSKRFIINPLSPELNTCEQRGLPENFYWGF